MANLRNTLIVLFLLFNDIILFSQTLVPFQRTFTTKDGLSHNNIECIGQDKFGFLWIGTFDGLCRYDGFEFKKYYSDPNDSSSLPYSHVNDLTIDKDNNIWIVGRILSRFDRHTESFVRFDQKDKRKISIDNVSCIETDTAGNLIILCKKGFYIYNSSVDSFLEIPVLDIKGQKITIFTDSAYFFIDRNNSFWLINSWTGLTFQFKCRKDLNNSSQMSICLENQYESEIRSYQNPGFSNHYWVYQTTNNKLWIMSNNGLFVKPENTDLIRKANEKEIKIIEFLSYKCVWWSSKSEGLNIIIPENNQLINIPGTTIKLSQTMFWDRDGNFWCGSLDSKETGDGLHQFIFQFPGFTYYPNQSSEEFRNLAVFSIFRNEKKEIFLGVKNFPYIIKINTNGKIEKTNPVIKEPWNTIYHPRSFLIDDDNR